MSPHADQAHRLHWCESRLTTISQTLHRLHTERTFLQEEARRLRSSLTAADVAEYETLGAPA